MRKEAPRKRKGISPSLLKEEEMNRKTGDRLDVAKVMEDFQKDEESSSGRNGTFKIDATFDDALRKIVKAKPGTKPAKK